MQQNIKLKPGTNKVEPNGGPVRVEKKIGRKKKSKLSNELSDSTLATAAVSASQEISLFYEDISHELDINGNGGELHMKDKS